MLFFFSQLSQDIHVALVKIIDHEISQDFFLSGVFIKRLVVFIVHLVSEYLRTMICHIRDYEILAQKMDFK